MSVVLMRTVNFYIFGKSFVKNCWLQKWFQLLIVYGLVIVSYSQYAGEGFGDPPFLEGPYREEIDFDPVLVDDWQIIEMDEEIPPPYIIAYINYQKENPAPQITSFTVGASSTLGPVLKYTEVNGTNYWALEITEKQDYETESMQAYKFSIKIQEDKRSISLIIRNIVDNFPIVVAKQSSCRFEEGITGETDCKFEVRDPDGFISQIQYELKNGPTDNFEIKATIEESDLYNSKLQLLVTKALDYDKYAIHLFNIEAVNSEAMVGSATVVVEVAPVRPPKWNLIFATKTFDEKSKQSFPISAFEVDNKKEETIIYKITPDNVKEDFFHIPKPEEGLIEIEPIDRDTLGKEIFGFTVHGCKKSDLSSCCDQNVVIIINDINDHAPEVTVKTPVQKINEEEYWEFTESISIDDIDLGINAQYKVELRDTPSKHEIGWYKSFNIIPNQGYQHGDFQLVITDATKLDYEVPEWQSIKLDIIATGLENTTHIGIGHLEIKLLNLNDEEPIFEKDGNFLVSLEESIGRGTEIVIAAATDRDIGDKLQYSLSPSSARSFSIDKSTGRIVTTLDKSLDYEVEKEVSIQVYAEDTFLDGITNKLHRTQANVVITVIDVNDKTPTLSVNSRDISIVENSEPGTNVDPLIEAYDPDSKAKLSFQIEWEKSWATKQGRTVELSEFKNCLGIELIDGATNNEATANLIVQRPDPSIDETIDYEKYEVLYLVINVTDENQEINQAWAIATVPIFIIDVNDNPPIFDTEITEQLKVVKDKATPNTLIGRVFATDADGPEFNYVTYKIGPIDDTPDNLVIIDKKTGEIRVSDSEDKISCDAPTYFESLNYTVIATDCENREGEIIDPCFDTPQKIQIKIEDVNDQVPSLVEFTEGTSVKVKEKCDNGVILNIIHGFDADRDELFRTISFDIDARMQPEIKNLFQVDSDGVVTVEKVGVNELDRDFGPSQYTIYINMYDNEHGTGQSQTKTEEFNLELIDINDQVPEFDSPSDFILKTISEKAVKGDTIDNIHASDNDDPRTLNTKVNYGVESARKLDPKTSQYGGSYKHLFEVITDQDKMNGLVAAKEDLKNYFGSYLLNLTVEDIGEPREPSNENHQEFKLVISPYNFDEPTILFPESGAKLILKEPDNIEDDLEWYDERKLELFKATDNYDGAKWQNMEFTIDLDDTFVMENIPNESKAKLKMVKLPENRYYQCSVTVVDNGTPSKVSTNKFEIHFVDESASPTFEIKKHYDEFTEGLPDPEEFVFIPEANDPFASLTGKSINYFILDGKDKENFVLNSKTRELKVNRNKPLDYQEKHFYNIDVFATNKEKPGLPNPDSVLPIEIKVKGTNRHAPVFNTSMFDYALTPSQEVGFLFQLDAYDVDANDTLRFELVQGSIEAHHVSLEKDKDRAFKVTQNGEVQLNIGLQPDMEGYYSFQVKVYDLVDHFAEAKVLVYVISDANRVIFKFYNTVEEVEQNWLNVEKIFSDAFESNCGVDNVYKDLDENGEALDNRTRVFTHFQNDTIPISADIINTKANDIDTYVRLTVEFNKFSLIYDSAYREQLKTDGSSDKLLQTTLMVVSAVLATLCVLLFVGFTVRTRSLNQRLEKLSTTKFGSQSSNLNRLGAPLPNTNQFAVDGSNPVWNEQMNTPNFDIASIGSGDSELIGVEDNSAFTPDDLNDEMERRASYNPVMRDHVLKRPSLNPMANPNAVNLDASPLERF